MQSEVFPVRTHTSCRYGLNGTPKTNPDVTAQEAPFELKTGEHLRLRIFIDRSIMEVFVNDRQCLTQRIFSGRTDSVVVELFSTGGI